MVQFHEKHDFSIGSLRIGGIIKGIEVLFECLNFLAFFISDFPDVSIGSTAYLFNDLVACKDMCFDVFAH